MRFEPLIRSMFLCLAVPLAACSGMGGTGAEPLDTADALTDHGPAWDPGHNDVFTDPGTVPDPGLVADPGADPWDPGSVIDPGPETDIITKTCEGLTCIATCTVDEECPPDHVCVVYAEGCCSHCGIVCAGDCGLSGAEYCAGEAPDELCEKGTIDLEDLGACWFEMTYTGEDGVDVLPVSGCSDFIGNLDNNACGIQYKLDTQTFLVACNWCGQVPYKEDFCCQPDCTDKECGDDGCGGTCGTCAVGCVCASGQCLGCGSDQEEMKPFCLHVPPVVTAGTTFPVAIYGNMECSVFDHVEVEVIQEAPGTYEVGVKVIGKPDPEIICVGFEVCELWMWNYLGIAWVQAQGPGTYHVTAGDQERTILASSGAMTEPACQDDCAIPLLESVDWTITHASEGAMVWGCNAYEDYDLEVSFDGQCQDYVIESSEYLMFQQPAKVKHCTDSLVLFESKSFPLADMSATVCQRPNPSGQTWWAMLGTITGVEWAGTASGLFLFEGWEPQAP